MIDIYSDGGGQKGSNAAAACIVDIGGVRTQLVSYLGAATNNEAEIFGGLLAFASLPALGGKRSEAVNWYCDSEYVLKSATQYIHNWQRNGWKTASKKAVKNQALWRTYLELSKGFGVKANHVYGHSGHPENEACDSAATWARAAGEQVLLESGDGALCDSLESYASGSWFLIDGRGILAQLRGLESGGYTEEAAMLLPQRLEALSVFNPDTHAPQGADPELLAEKKLELVRKSLLENLAELRRLEAHSAEAGRLSKALEALLE